MAGRTVEAGYGATHKRLRRDWEPIVAAGGVACWRCALLIDPEEDWHLGHDDHDRSITRGPEHVDCNLRRSPRTGPQRWSSEDW